jgi:hypothetical protein
MDPKRSKSLMVYDSSRYDLRICALDSNVAIYFVEHSSWASNKPDLILHAGADQQGPVLGVGHFPCFGAKTIGLGDPRRDVNAMIWEKLSCTTKWTHAEYEFEFPFGDEHRRTKFRWRRTKTRVFSDQGDMELVKVGREDDILASYVGFGLLDSLKKRAVVTIREGFGEQWELMVWLTGLSLVELSRRRARARRNKIR